MDFGFGLANYKFRIYEEEEEEGENTHTEQYFNQFTNNERESLNRYIDRNLHIRIIAWLTKYL